MRRLFLGLVLCLCASVSVAKDQAGVFDYYVMSLSWSPNWCDRTGTDQSSPQCDPDRDLGWSLHGLWPQYESGWPSDCETSGAWPTRSETADMADIMGTDGLAFYEWRKHGTCSGLDSAMYFKLARKAYDRVVRPKVFRSLTKSYHLPASVIEKAFLLDNPQLEADQITVTCKAQQIQEVRICLTKTLSPRDCGRDVIRDCTLEDAEFHPIP